MQPWPEYLQSRRAEKSRWSAALRRCQTWLERLLPDFPFPLVEIPELAAGHDFLEIFAALLGTGQILGERRVEEGDVVFAWRLDHSVGTQARDIAADEAHRLVHGVGKRVTGVAADNHRPLL